ncbi:sulfite exporter TauE/SafE family protein [Nocardioides anomalus]|uniref:Probable membrane transporter protein n=1 Tax=Nocardioides anomalus TaxID=2712223 RepID=A0A6G6WD22_9ACTN|nr:sulfite exporter TauE/SafE family protein [Nocardioides anomalus]QIG43142.1 sulfite exporter TauE/SafE family protein [Nocardioides anomalus]
MSPLEALAIGLAGLAAGTINTVVGSGTLITFPTLLAFGVPPVTANVSNTIGLVPGSLSGVVGYRRELVGQRARMLRIGVASLIGGIVGGVLLLVLPADAFSAIVPVLVGLGIVLVLFQPRISAWTARRHEAAGAAPRNPTYGAWWVWPAVLLAGVYGGYFGAAQGVLLMGIMGVGIPETLQRLNGLKNVLAAIVNAVAGLLFAVVADVDWRIVALIGIGSVIGGQLGATVGRRLPAPVLRGVIVVVGAVALVVFLVS